MFSRKQAAVLFAEFLGTGMLALVMLSVHYSTIGVPYFVALASGAALAVMVAVFAGNGAGHFNPAITIGMWTVRQIRTLRAIGYIIAQMLGAWAAYYVYTYFIKTTLQPIGGGYDPHVLVAEAVGALLLSLGYAAAVFNGYTNTKKAGTVGAAYVLAIIVAASVTVGIVNPAVALSMRAFDVFGSMGWGTYVLGPVLGAVIGCNLFALLFAEESSFVRVRAVVTSRLGSARAAATVAAKPAAEPAKTTSKTTSRRTSRTTTSRGRKTRSSRSKK